MDGGGLWIWAFFSETPFPFMLFSLQLTKVLLQAHLQSSSEQLGQGRENCRVSVREGRFCVFAGGFTSGQGLHGSNFSGGAN